MTYIVYEDRNFSPKSTLEIEQAREIIEEYEAQGYTLTLRQLYYQFVARDLRENTERSYKNLGTLITNARMAGLISWKAIEDRNRSAHLPYINEDELDILDGLDVLLKMDCWADQDHYVEVWIEKEALGNVIDRPCKSLQVSHMACKGYLSASEAWRAGRRFRNARQEGKTPVLIHLGDHDPSGIDMTRDNKDRLEIFSEDGVDVRRIALNMDQVEQYGPPPNPAKVSDSRAPGYIKEFGPTSWELDALEPSVIDTLITEEIEQFINWDKWKGVKDEQTERRAHLAQLHDNWDEIVQFLNDMDEE